jgi:hypothetical protein
MINEGKEIEETAYICGNYTIVNIICERKQGT